MTEAPRPEPVRIFSLPRTRQVSWIPTALEFSYQLILACWMGGIAVLGFLVVPGLYTTIRNSHEAAWAGLELTMNLNFVSAGAGSLLLLIILVMYLLALRTQKATFVQIALILVMTGGAVASHVFIGPEMSEVLRSHTDLAAMDEIALAELQALSRWSAALIGLQILAGAVALIPGVRRWYRYTTPTPNKEEPMLVAADAD